MTLRTDTRPEMDDMIEHYAAQGWLLVRLFVMGDGSCYAQLRPVNSPCEVEL